MGYFDSRDELLDRLDSHYSNARYHYNASWVSRENAVIQYLARDIWPCIYFLISTHTHQINAIKYLVYQSEDCLYNADIIHHLSEYTGVTWKSIAEAWVKDDFEGRVWTIGTIDRMRQILWNEPFNLKWAARPEENEVG